MRQAKKYFKLFSIAVSALCIAAAVWGCSGSGSETAVSQSGTNKIEEGEFLEIPISAVTEKASFYTAEVEDTELEVIAIRDKAGTIRTALNTCQVCYDSGRGYYKQSGDYLICQNCGNKFTAEQVETESGGCNPWPIFETDKTVTEDYIRISYDFLNKSRKIFANRKAS